jgi:serine/threonine-protein kinase RsbW
MAANIPRHLLVIFPREPQTAAKTRHLVRTSLSAWTLDSMADSAALVISELVTNAVCHARGPMLRVIVERPTPDQVYLGVVDRDPNHLPHQQEPDLEAAGGRGLLMVDALTDRWGCDRLGSTTRPWGKRTWGVVGAKRDMWAGAETAPWKVLVG